MFYSVVKALRGFFQNWWTRYSLLRSLVCHDVMLIQYCTTTCFVSCIDNANDLLWELLI